MLGRDFFIGWCLVAEFCSFQVFLILFGFYQRSSEGQFGLRLRMVGVQFHWDLVSTINVHFRQDARPYLC